MKILGSFEQAVLIAIVRLGDGAYGRAILTEAQLRLRRQLAAGAVYSTLDRLEQQGLISSRLEPGPPIRAGRPRRYYVLKRAGARALNESKAAVENIWQGLQWPVNGGA
jgi:PadR family transcriptional regulator, regulatory protein PadR